MARAESALYFVLVYREKKEKNKNINKILIIKNTKIKIKYYNNKKVK